MIEPKMKTDNTEKTVEDEWIEISRLLHAQKSTTEPELSQTNTTDIWLTVFVASLIMIFLILSILVFGVTLTKPAAIGLALCIMLCVITAVTSIFLRKG